MNAFVYIYKLASFSTDTSRPPAPPTRPPRVEYASAVESGPVSESEVMAVASTQTLIPPVAVDMGGPPYQIIINTQGFRVSLATLPFYFYFYFLAHPPFFSLRIIDVFCGRSYH